VDILWTSCGHPVDNLVHPVDNLRTSCGQFVDIQSITWRHLVDTLCTTYGHLGGMLWKLVDILLYSGHMINTCCVFWGEKLIAFVCTLLHSCYILFFTELLLTSS